MNKIIKKKWLKALRSKEYKQTTQRLKHTNDKTGKVCFCVLGVLCDLYIKDVEGRWVSGCTTNKAIKSVGNLNGTLPIPVYKWAGLPDDNPNLDGSYIACLNDDDGLSFKKLANLIEKEF